jgi:hypothetical protein
VGLRLCFAPIALVLLALPGARAAGAQPAERQAKPLSVAPPQDAAIQRRIEDILAALGGLEAVEVEVRSGVVRIGGRAQSLALREEATELAQRVEGVVLVRNEVHVASRLRDRLRPTWVKLKEHLSRTLGYLPVLAVALLAFGAFWALSRALSRWERPFRQLGLSRLGVSALRIPLRALLLTAGVIVALDILGLVAFAGTVVGALGIIGNVRLLQEPIVNFERHRERRMRLLLDVAMSADLRRVREVGRETLLALKGVLPEPRPSMRVMSIEADQVRIAFFAWIDQRKTSFPERESSARQAVKEALLAAHFREEQAEPGARDLLREGRSRAP